MKEYWSTLKDRTVLLEEGLPQNVDGLSVKPVTTNYSWKQVLQFIKLIFYLELLLFIGWAGYSLWQAYRIQSLEVRISDIVRESESQSLFEPESIHILKEANDISNKEMEDESKHSAQHLNNNSLGNKIASVVTGTQTPDLDITKRAFQIKEHSPRIGVPNAEEEEAVNVSVLKKLQSAILEANASNSEEKGIGNISEINKSNPTIITSDTSDEVEMEMEYNSKTNESSDDYSNLSDINKSVMEWSFPFLGLIHGFADYDNAHTDNKHEETLKSIGKRTEPSSEIDGSSTDKDLKEFEEYVKYHEDREEFYENYGFLSFKLPSFRRNSEDEIERTTSFDDDVTTGQNTNYVTPVNIQESSSAESTAEEDDTFSRNSEADFWKFLICKALKIYLCTSAEWNLYPKTLCTDEDTQLLNSNYFESAYNVHRMCYDEVFVPLKLAQEEIISDMEENSSLEKSTDITRIVTRSIKERSSTEDMSNKDVTKYEKLLELLINNGDVRRLFSIKIDDLEALQHAEENFRNRITGAIKNEKSSNTLTDSAETVWQLLSMTLLDEEASLLQNSQQFNDDDAQLI